MEIENICKKDFGNFLHDRCYRKKPHKRISKEQKIYFKILNENMVKKSSKRIDNIKIRIQNDISKNIFNKKYQIKSIVEFMVIKDFCNNFNIDEYELNWCHDEKGIMVNKLYQIIEVYSDGPMKFINRKTPVMYCYFSKKNSEF